MKKLFLFPAILVLASCAQYAVVESGPQTIGSMTVTPSQEWNKVPGIASVGKLPSWTADGVSLNTVAFISDVESGEPLVQATQDEEYPIFQSNMLPTEMVDLFESTLTKLYNAKLSGSGELKPLMIDGNPGFEYTFEFVTPDEITRKGYLAGTVKNEKLHMIFYQAARMYYFDQRYQNVKHMVSSMTIN